MSTTLPITEQKIVYAFTMASSPSSPRASPVKAAPPSPSHQILQIQRLKSQASSSSTSTTTTTTPTRNPRTPPRSSTSAGSAVAGSNNEPVRNPMVMVFMLFFGLLLALLIMAFFAYAPFLCASWLALMYMVFLYLTNERNWWWHDAQEFENRFWTMTAFLFSLAVFYIHDSPLAVGRWNSSFGMFMVFAFTSSVHFLDRFIHRKEISRKPRLRQAPELHAEHLFKYKATAEEKATLVSECVTRIDRMVLPSTINNMINLAQVKTQEQKIFRILAGASKDELNYIINNVRLALLFYKVKDHSKVRSDMSRTLILDLLCSTRLADLNVTSRAILLDALMVMKLSAHPMSERWVRNIILKTSGDDLSNLKTFSDGKGDFHSIHKLVFNDIRDQTIRNDILNHIRREAGVQTAHMRLGTKRAMKRRQQAWRKVLSDVDDTLYSSGGRYPAGLDTRYPRHALYPGVLPFYRELDMGTAGPDEWTDDRIGNLVFLSARPHVYKDMSEKKSYAKFAALYENKGMHTLPTMLAGNLTSGRAFMVQGDLGPMAQKKFENFGEYYQLYPEFTHVFVGDNGQGDVRAAELIVEKFGSGALEAAFFQLVQPIEKTFGYRSKDDVEKWRKMNIVFFNTYPGAAVEAYNMGKIRLAGLKKVCDEAVKNFEELATWPTPDNRERARILLNDDLVRANRLLEKGKLATVPLLVRPQAFKINSDVRTPFGKGIVRKYRGVDAIYHVDLIEFSSTRKRRAQGFFTEESLVPFVAGDLSPIVKSTLKYVKVRKAPLGRIYPPQTLVTTPFGDGRVVRFRAEDEIYVVSIDAGANSMPMTGYFAPDAIYQAKRLMSETDYTSPRMFAGVRSSLGYITKRLSTFVPGSTMPKPLYTVGAAVETPFGRAFVLRMRPFDRVYEVQLLRADMNNTIVLIHEQSMRVAMASPSRSFFSRLGLGGSSKSTSSTTPTTGSTSIIMERSPVATPYGKGIVQSYRGEDQIYEIQLTDWILANGQTVTAYLTKQYVREIIPTLDEMPALSLSAKASGDDQAPPSSGGIFQLFRYGFSGSSASNITVVPYADEGATRRVDTPFGVGHTTMAKPYNGCVKVTMDAPHLMGVVAYVQDAELTELPATHVRRNTLELLGYPFSYLRGGWTSTAPSENGSLIERSATPRGPAFSLGSLVATPFGNGLVASYRTSDAIYTVHLDGGISGFFQATALAHAVRGALGSPVSTHFGSGLLVQVRPEDGVHVVTLRHALVEKLEIRGYFQPLAVLKTLKAARGDLVQTPYGKGVVVSYRAVDDFYCVALEWDLKGRSHVSAFIRAANIVRSGPVEKASSGCSVM